MPALQRPPCLVPFSGGRDSSVVLAVAARVARREKLALPIPVTLRFSWASQTDETMWQELVIKHLALSDWEHLEYSNAGGELDLVGPVPARCLLRHGLLWPANTHLYAPMLECARGGSLLSGLDGDGVFGGWTWTRIGAVLARRASPEPRDLLRIGHALAPALVREWLARRRGEHPTVTPWLRPGARAAYVRMALREQRGPLRWSDHVAALARARYLVVACASYQALADDADALLIHPFLDRRFLAALARAGGPWGWGGRGATTAALFGELLPAETARRGTKASFDEVLWGEPSRRFAREWDGSGIDEELVDPDALRAEWLAAEPHAGSGALLQSAWLHARRRTLPASATSGAGGAAC